MDTDNTCLWRRLAVAALAAALLAALPIGSRAQTADAFGEAVLKGAGSTFAHPLLAAWARDYRSVRTGGLPVAMAGAGLDDDIGGVALDYEAVGSQAGIQRVKTRAVDFAVSEMPLPAADLQRGKLVQVPIVAGAVAVAIHLDAARSRELKLTPAVLADIFLGRIKRWNDAAIVQLNDGLSLPPTPITVVHRADGSGTTFTATRFLSQASSDWRNQVGSDLLVNWPVGNAQRGSSGVAKALAATPGAIGFLDLVQAQASRLAVASVQNRSGRFVAPAKGSVQAAVAAADWNAAGQFNTSLVNQAGDGVYPVVAAVYGLAGDNRQGERAAKARAFLDWSITGGRQAAERLGYVALPPAVVTQVRAALK
ncbi:MAG: phosphate ABC transporter substrate-binding protein PstS [Rhizobacter sp.]